MNIGHFPCNCRAMCNEVLSIKLRDNQGMTTSQFHLKAPVQFIIQSLVQYKDIR